jgi:hypothetical protein
MVAVASRFHLSERMLSQPPREPSAETLNDIRNRLGRVCQGYSADEFAQLVRQIASVQVKYDAIRVEAFREAARQLASEQPQSGRESPWRGDPSSEGVSWR